MNSRAIQNLELLAFAKTEVIFWPCFIIIKCYKECHSYKQNVYKSIDSNKQKLPPNSNQIFEQSLMEKIVCYSFAIHTLVAKSKNSTVPICVTCSTPRSQRSGVRGRVHSTEHSHALTDGGMEVVVVGDGGDSKDGIVLRCRVGPIAISCVLWDTSFSVVCEFGRLFVLTLHTAHYLYSMEINECLCTDIMTEWTRHSKQPSN